TRPLFFEPHSENLYMRGFLSDIFIRPSCFECPAKRGRSSADITLGDFWGLSRNYPLLYARGLYSLLLVNSETGMEALKKAGIEMAEAEYKIAVIANKGLETSPCRARYTSRFWSLYKTEGIEAIPAILDAMRPSLPRRAWWWLRAMLTGH
ncbi:MAG: Coenzyme F420 hydrogenase/dehydrogenase, beta subunit C-terminal domain, partial [Duncaniella sp.]|nr:Coenzyme F420 hydrogenase/dehydrogenase, beta subunit C-terminal domain [Duncaniella sp.]